MKKFLFILALLLVTGCASKEPVREINVMPTIAECPSPERPTLKLLKSGHLGSKESLSVILENFNLLELYSSQLENTVDCYDKQVVATKKAQEQLQEQDSYHKN